MWNKPTIPESPSPSTRPTPSLTSPSASPSPSPSSSSASRSRIGAGTTVKGTLQGREDLVVEGRVEGRIELGQSSVVIDEAGRVEGDVIARTIKVSGEVHGNLTAEEDAVLLKTARLEGNIVAKRVTIESGARFRGSIDMEAGVPHNRAAPTPPPLKERADSGSAVVSKPNGSTERLGIG
jgi:cytoskeletal protein CcmA (bactofilin family)